MLPGNAAPLYLLPGPVRMGGRGIVGCSPEAGKWALALPLASTSYPHQLERLPSAPEPADVPAESGGGKGTETKCPLLAAAAPVPSAFSLAALGAGL